MSDEQERGIDKIVDRLTAELKTANVDRNDLVDRLCAVAGENTRLTAERDQAREQLAKLRDACGGVSDGLIRTATHGVENLTKRDWLIQTAQNIRDALESEAGE